MTSPARANSPRLTGRPRALNLAVERLLHRRRPHRPRRLAARERRVETAAAVLFLAAATALAMLVPSDREFSLGVALALMAAYALAARVRLYVGAGYTVPTQLVLVPMLFWLPATTVPLLVAGAIAAGALFDAARGRAHAERALTVVADSWHALGPSLVVLAAGEPGAANVSWPVVALAVAAQCLVDLLVSTGREWAGRGIAPALQLRVIASVYLVDACLTPVAVLAAAAGPLAAAPVAAIASLLAVLAVFALERRARIDELTSRLDDLQEERRRHDASIRHVGEASRAGLDRPALLEVVLRTAMDGLGADCGLARSGGSEVRAGTLDADLAEALEAAAAAVADGGAPASALHATSAAVAHPLAADGGGFVAVARAERPFSDDERALFGDLATQVAVAMGNVALHERLGREARVDELTGLANHRHFQDSLRQELDRMRRFRRSIALVMLDIDHFKSVNDTYGHQQGDEVLRSVADALRQACRSTDVVARYGGEELAAILPDTDLEGAVAAGENIRRAVEALRIPRPGAPPLRVTVSVGVAAASPRTADAAALVAAADAALYEAKRGGRNRTVRAPGDRDATAPAPRPCAR